MHTVMATLAEPNRLKIIEHLRDQSLSVQQISELLHRSQPLVSKHLRTLREAGLVKAQVVAQQRIYSIQTRPLEDLDSWIATFRPLWNKRLNRMEAYLKKVSTNKGGAKHE